MLRYINGLLTFTPAAHRGYIRLFLVDKHRFGDQREFHESDVCRDHGKFARKGEGRLGKSNEAASKPNEAGSKFDEAAFKELCGPEVKGVPRKYAALALLLKGEGHIKGAFHRDDVGDIDLLYGDDSLGLKHIVQRRLKADPGMDIVSFVSGLADVVETGDVYYNKDRDNFEIWKNNKMCVVTRTFHGKEMHLVITAYPSKRKPSRFSR